MRPIFALRVRAEPNVDAIRSLRRWLKQGLRQFGLRCLDIRQEDEPKEETSNVEEPHPATADPGKQ